MFGDHIELTSVKITRKPGTVPSQESKMGGNLTMHSSQCPKVIFWLGCLRGIFFTERGLGVDKCESEGHEKERKTRIINLYVNVLECGGCFIR